MNRDDLRPVARQRLYEQVAEQILTWVRDNQLEPGDRLPAERDLAARLGVSRATVSQAFVAMEVVGVVAVRHGGGVVLLEPEDGAQVATALREHAKHLPEIIEARDALESKLAALAAERRTDEDMRRIDSALEQMEADVAAGGRGVEGDKSFHAAITAAGHSFLLARLMDEISDLVVETRVESLSQEGRPSTSLDQHRAVAEAVRSREPQEAARAMHDHIATVSDVALLRED